MKAKHNISEKGKRLESPKVEPPKQPAQANKEGLGIDLKDFHALCEIKHTLEKLCCLNPSVIDCEDESLAAYKKASALLTYAGLADLGLHAEGSELVEPISSWIMDSIQLQLDIVRLAAEHLFTRCEAKEQVEVQASKSA